MAALNGDLCLINGEVSVFPAIVRKDTLPILAAMQERASSKSAVKTANLIEDDPALSTRTELLLSVFSTA